MNKKPRRIGIRSESREEAIEGSLLCLDEWRFDIELCKESRKPSSGSGYVGMSACWGSWISFWFSSCRVLRIEDRLVRDL